MSRYTADCMVRAVLALDHTRYTGSVGNNGRDKAPQTRLHVHAPFGPRVLHLEVELIRVAEGGLEAQILSWRHRGFQEEEGSERGATKAAYRGFQRGPRIRNACWRVPWRRGVTVRGKRSNRGSGWGRQERVGKRDHMLQGRWRRGGRVGEKRKT